MSHVRSFPVAIALMGWMVGAASARAAETAYDYDSQQVLIQAAQLSAAPVAAVLPTPDDPAMPDLRKRAPTVQLAANPSSAAMQPVVIGAVSAPGQPQGQMPQFIVIQPQVLPTQAQLLPAQAQVLPTQPQLLPTTVPAKPAARPAETILQASAAVTNRATKLVRPAPSGTQARQAVYTDHHTGIRTGISQDPTTPPTPEPISPGGRVHMSDGDNCAQCAPMQCAPGQCSPMQCAPGQCSPMQCDSCCPDCGPQPDICFSPCGCCGCFAGVDYLLLRPSFSENTAYFKRTTTTNGAVTITDEVVHHDFGYDSGARLFAGYRFCDCGGEVQFTYWNYSGESSQASGRANSTTTYAAPLEIVTQIPGQRLQVNSDIDMNIYDIDYSKCIVLGGCNPCKPCQCCPVWTLKYSAGVRIADIDRRNNIFLLSATDAGVREGIITSDFIGAGPKLGLEGRRFFHEGCCSLFARGNFSLLIGDYDLAETRNSPPVNPIVTENYFDSHVRVIPVAEIELGGTWQCNDRFRLSAGYLVQCWWDLGAFEEAQGNVFLNTTDDANILAFDGLFARAEFCF